MRNDPPGTSISSVSTTSGYDARGPAEAMTRSPDVCLRVGPIAVNVDMSRNRGDVGAHPDTELAADAGRHRGRRDGPVSPLLLPRRQSACCTHAHVSR